MSSTGCLVVVKAHQTEGNGWKVALAVAGLSFSQKLSSHPNQTAALCLTQGS
jgi:hypothetical protein